MAKSYSQVKRSRKKKLSSKKEEETRGIKIASGKYSEGTFENETSSREEEPSDEFHGAIAGRISGSMEQLERIQNPEETVVNEVRETLKDCLECYQTCTETLRKCLKMGGKHAKLEHINLLMDCTIICDLSADFILRNSSYYPQTCSITADICDECSDSCDRFDEDFMKECASICRRCAESCREMAR